MKKVEEMTTSANIATTPSPFIMMSKTPWPFSGTYPQVLPLSRMRKKGQDRFQKRYGSVVLAGDLWGW